MAMETERRTAIAVVATSHGRTVMCDYSLESVPSRLAVIDDRLITSHYPTTNARGFASVEEPSTAVCLLAGTEIVFSHEPKYWRPALFWSRKAIASSKVARFRQIDLAVRTTHHDALEFSDGAVVL